MTMFKPEKIKVGNNEVILKKEKLTEIFKFHQTPYICTGMSGGGKTSLALDIIYTFAPECTNVYYITKTQPSFTENSISQIPKAFIRLPTFENIADIWSEIVKMFAAFSASPEKITEIIIKIYGEKITQALLDDMEEQKNEIIKRNTALYKKQGVSNENIQSYIQKDLLAFEYEFKKRVILFGLNDTPNRAELEEKLTQDQTDIINSLVSTPPKVLLIFDDITAEIGEMRVNKDRIYINGSYISKAQAFSGIICDILTRVRHFNCLVVFFVHSFDSFEPKERDKIDRTILFDDSMLTKLQSLRTFPKNMKYFLTAAGDKVFGKFKHTFLYYACSENHVSVGKADLHIAEKIKLSDTLQQYCDIFDKINSGFVSSIEEDTKQQTEEQNEQDEGEYEEDNGDGGDDGDDSTKIEAIL